MKISPQGAGMIASQEAIYLFAYQDSVGVWTMGGGHTAAAGGLIPRRGMRCTLEEACAMLMVDIDGKYGPRVARAIKRRLDQHVYDGFTSFDLNTGAILNGSVDDRWNRGDEAGAIAVLTQYVNAGGKRLTGLYNRRKMEAAVIRDGHYPSALVLVKVSAGDPGRSVPASSLPWTSQVPAGMSITPNTIEVFTPPPTHLPVPLTPVSVWDRLINWWTSK